MASTMIAAFPVADGYVVEALITATDLGLATWTPTVAASLGFDLGVDFGAPGADSSCMNLGGALVLRSLPMVPDGGCGRPDCTPTAFCTPRLQP